MKKNICYLKSTKYDIVIPSGINHFDSCVFVVIDNNLDNNVQGLHNITFNNLSLYCMCGINYLGSARILSILFDILNCATCAFPCLHEV